MEAYICINTHGAYFVEIPLPPEKREEGKVSVYQAFSPSAYDGEKGALAAAIAWRNEQGRELYGALFKKMLKLGRRMPKRKVRAGTKHGVVPGVHFEPQRGKAGAYSACWVHWESPEKKINKTKTFSVGKYGDAEAKRLAIKAREEGVKVGLKALGSTRHHRTNKGLGGFYREDEKKAWVVLWEENGDKQSREFPDKDFPMPINKKPSSWWSYLSALEFRKDKDVSTKGRTYLPATDAKVENFYQQKMRAAA